MRAKSKQIWIYDTVPVINTLPSQGMWNRYQGIHFTYLFSDGWTFWCSIVYFYSSLARFLLVASLFLFLYAIQVNSPFDLSLMLKYRYRTTPTRQDACFWIRIMIGSGFSHVRSHCRNSRRAKLPNWKKEKKQVSKCWMFSPEDWGFSFAKVQHWYLKCFIM